MLPAIVQRQIQHAEAVAMGLNDAASICSIEQEALRTRLSESAHTIIILIALVKSATWAAKLNHDTVVEMRR